MNLIKKIKMSKAIVYIFIITSIIIAMMILSPGIPPYSAIYRSTEGEINKECKCLGINDPNSKSEELPAGLVKIVCFGLSYNCSYSRIP